MRDDRSDEENWIKLGDGSILNYDIFSSIAAGVGKAERYVPSKNQWVDASKGDLPLLSDNEELGPGVLLPDGRALYFGETGNIALYDPVADSWTRGPSIPDGLVMGDAPAAVLSNGRVVLAASPRSGDGPTTFFEFDPATGRYANVTPPGGIIDTTGNDYTFAMLVLPTGQIMVTNGSGRVALYTPDKAPRPTWKPTITAVKDIGDGSFVLTGTQLNGLNEGAAYGDDNQMSSNYPLVRLTDRSNGNVLYAKTFDWSLTGVATGITPESVRFVLPKSLRHDPYSLEVVANGIASTSFAQMDITGIARSNFRGLS